MTLSFKVNRQGQVFVFNIFDILDLENVRIDTKIDFVSCLQPEIWKVMQKVFDLDFQGQTSRSGDLFWVFWDPRLCKC